ncbi:MAG: polysaccharide biosynthesis C-terminal domain-containing protein [Pseudomonadota bacterium]
MQVFALMVSAIVLARTLGPEGLGIVAIVMAAVRVAVIPAQEGAVKLSERELAGALGKSDRAQALSALKFSIFAALFVFTMGLGLVYAFLKQTTLTDDSVQFNAVVIAATAILVAAIANSVLKGVLRGLGQTVTAVRLSNLITLSIPLMYLMWIWLVEPLTPAVALWINAFCRVAYLPLLTLVARRSWSLVPRPGSEAESMKIPRQWYFESVQFTVLGVITIALMEVSTLILASVSTPEEVGWFRIASRVFVVTGFVTYAAQSAFGPRIAFTWQAGNEDALERPARMISTMALIFSLVFVVLFALFGEWAVSAVFGSEFEEAFFPALIMSVAGVSLSLSATSGKLLKMTGEQTTVIYGSAVGLLIAIGLNLQLAPDHGAVGSAIALLVALPTAQVIYVWGVKRHLGFRPLPSVESARALLNRFRKALG